MNAEELKNIEHLCEELYNSPDPNIRSNAEQQLLSLQTSAEYIPQCQYILDNSQIPYALHLASSALTKLITQYWNNFQMAQRVDVRNYLLEYLSNKGPQLPDYVATSIIVLICRITKLGWLDDAPQHREIIDEVKRFLDAGQDWTVIGLKILKQLVEEFNIPTTGRAMTQHRKMAVSFREICLLKIFETALRYLESVQSGSMGSNFSFQQQEAIGACALKLCVGCFSFDFIGTNPDESGEDVGTIQVPTAWRSIIQNPNTLQLLLDFYRNKEPPQSEYALQSIILLSSVRRSLFQSDDERSGFLQRLMSAIKDILSTEIGLQHHANYHEFCRLLGRIKANYQLSDIVKTDGFSEWLELAAQFTVKSFQQWQHFHNSIHYLLSLWGRLISAIPYVPRNPVLEKMQQCVLQVIQAYIKSMIDAVTEIVNSEYGIDDPLEDEGSLKEQLDKLPMIIVYQYRATAEYLLTYFDPILKQYTDILQSSFQMSGNMNGGYREIHILEGQLTWLVYIVGAIVGGHSPADLHSNDGKERIDAIMARRVMQLAETLNFRLHNSNGQAKASEKLELACLYFFQNFRRVYPCEQNLASILDHASLRSDSLPAIKQKIHAQMYQEMGMGDNITVTNIIVTKIANNLKYWGNNEDVISKTLQLFLDMTGGCSTSKVLVRLDTVEFILHHHSAEFFPFLDVPSNAKHRTSFHAILARLVVSVMDDQSNNFEAFMSPILSVLDQLNKMENLRQEDVRRAIIGVCRDLRGVTQAMPTKKTYAALFELLYPQFFPVFVRATEVWYDNPDVTTALLKFLQEFVYNKAQRLIFDQSSPNGILLFREASKIIVAYGSRILNKHIENDVYREKYKGIAITLTILTNALNGNYVNFGVFALYNDNALDSALEVALQLALSIPFAEIFSYPKLSKAYFGFFEILFRNHIQNILMLDTPIFLQIIQSQHEGLQSVGDGPLAAQCAASIDYLATYYFTNKNKDRPAIICLRKHLQQQPNLLSILIASLFNQLLFGGNTNNLSVTRPIISLMLASEEDFNAYKEHLISTQNPENQKRLANEFDKVLNNVQKNLEHSNRERFQQRLRSFRLDVQSFLTV